MANTLDVTLSRSSLASGVINQLRRDIILRVYKPGEKLTEQFISEKYGISRSPIRSIMQQLEKEGMIVVLENGCKQVVGFTKNDLISLYDYRNYLEITAVKTIFAAETRQYSSLLALLEMLETKGSALSLDWIASDIEFHRALIKMSGNRYLITAYNTISPTLYTLFSINVSLYRRQFVDEYDTRHTVLVKSLISDPLEDCLKKFREHHDYALERALVAMDMIEKNQLSSSVT